MTEPTDAKWGQPAHSGEPYEWVLSQWCLAIWNPNLMDFIPNKHRRDSRKLFYRAMGIVTHDRALNGRPAC